MIDPYDRRAVEAVWRRVQAAQFARQTVEGFLWELLSMELERSRCCRGLARRTPRLRQQLHQIAARGEKTCQRLRRACPKQLPRLLPAVAREELPLLRALERLGQDAAAAAEACAEGARHYPDMAKLLRSISEENRRQSRILLSLSGGKP